MLSNPRLVVIANYVALVQHHELRTNAIISDDKNIISCDDEVEIQ